MYDTSDLLRGTNEATARKRVLELPAEIYEDKPLE